MADQDFILAPATVMVDVNFALEPAYSVLNSLMLLSHPEERSGFGEWILRTAASLPPDRVRTHRLIFSAFVGALDEADAPSFPALLDKLAAEDAVALRDRAIKWVTEKEVAGLAPLDAKRLMSDEAAYSHYMERFYREKMNEKEFHLDPSLFKEAHTLLVKPSALQEMLVSHLRWMWENRMKAEWERNQPMLQESVEAFRQLDLSHLTALEVIRVVTGRDVSGIWDEWPDRIIFVPSAHIGPYLTRYDSRDQTLTRLVFGARLPEGARVSSPALSRSELLVRLNALADDTRLRILELLTQHEELCAQDVIEMLELSQSAASRHLRQLTATGYLIERRREVAKCYTLNPQRMDDTLRALKRFLRAK